MRRVTAVAVNLASLSQQLISVGLLIGGFYLELSGAPARDGYFMLVLTGQGDHWKVRSLVFAPKP